MDNATPVFTQEEFDLLEFAVWTAMRQLWYEGHDTQDLSDLRQKLLAHVSKAHFCAVS